MHIISNTRTCSGSSQHRCCVQASLEALHADNHKQAAELDAAADCAVELQASERRMHDVVATHESTIAELQLQLSLMQQRAGAIPS